jgi:hypothetical protein
MARHVTTTANIRDFIHFYFSFENKSGARKTHKDTDNFLVTAMTG